MKKIYLILTLFCISNLNAAIIYVDKNATGNNNGTTWSNAYITIELAFSNSIVGDKIWVAQGVYKPAGTLRTTAYNIPNGVEVYGSFIGNETAVNQRNLTNGPLTTLNGDINNVGVNTDNCYSVVKFTNVSNLTVFDGFKIINGYNNSSSSASGGAIYNIGGQPSIRNCEFLANFAINGGAIGNSTTLANITTITSCKITNNSSSLDGGAIYNNSGTLKLIDCDISNNTAPYGGAINIQFDLVIVDRCKISGNSASDNGGAIYLDNSDSKIEIYNSLLVGNFAPEKSVMGMNSPVSNTNLSKIIGCTIVNNRNTGTSPNSSFVIVMPYNNGIFQNNILTNNISPRVLLNGYVNNCIIDEIFAANSSSNVSTVAPTFVSPNIAAAAPFIHNNYNYSLSNNSNGINSGNNNYVSPLYNLDLNSSARIYQTTVDIGAYESVVLATENFSTNLVKCYPNPTQNSITISNINENIKYSIFTVSGLLVKEGDVDSQRNVIDISSFQSGLYLLKTSKGEIINIIKN
jgi:predicted outer membrane repeat protein